MIIVKAELSMGESTYDEFIGDLETNQFVIVKYKKRFIKITKEE